MTNPMSDRLGALRRDVARALAILEVVIAGESRDLSEFALQSLRTRLDALPLADEVSITDAENDFLERVASDGCFRRVVAAAASFQILGFLSVPINTFYSHTGLYSEDDILEYVQFFALIPRALRDFVDDIRKIGGEELFEESWRTGRGFDRDADGVSIATLRTLCRNIDGMAVLHCALSAGSAAPEEIRYLRHECIKARGAGPSACRQVEGYILVCVRGDDSLSRLYTTSEQLRLLSLTCATVNALDDRSGSRGLTDSEVSLYRQLVRRSVPMAGYIKDAVDVIIGQGQRDHPFQASSQ